MTTAAPTIGQDFAARMKQLGVTQEFLAAYTGLSQSAISKAVNELTDNQRTKIHNAIQELETVAECFKPMKPLFDDVDAVKKWLSSPNLPNLFALLSPAQLLKATSQELTSLNASYTESERLEGEIAAIQEKSRQEWITFLEEVSAYARR
jgi:transcriptional regulator with XRE-family HTH domain